VPCSMQQWSEGGGAISRSVHNDHEAYCQPAENIQCQES
jgi:hypothetical protein